MTILFSEYLVQNNYITQDLVTEALVVQLRETPCMAEVIHDKGLLLKKDLLKILSYQQKNNLDFCESAKAVGLWTKELYEKIIKQIDAVRRPLGEILIEKGMLNAESLSTAFVSYVEESSKPKSQERLFETSPIGEAHSFLVKDFVAAFQNKLRLPIENIIISLEALPKSEEAPKVIEEKFHVLIQTALVEFKGIQTDISFVSEKQLQSIIQSTIQLLEFFVSTKVPIEIPCVISILKSTLQILDSIVLYLKNFQ